MEGIVGTTTRLAAGSTDRTEADIQSDVRKFLLDAPLDLDQGELVDIALEAQAGGGRRIDVEAGCAAIEVKKSLRSPSVLAEAVDQLAAYVKQRTEERTQRYVGILTDGKLWVLFHRQPDDTLAEVQRLTLAGGEDAPRLASWLESGLATTEQIKPSPREVERRLGALSPATQLDLADLRSLYAASRRNPEVQLKRELWARLLVAALGTNFAAWSASGPSLLVEQAERCARLVSGHRWRFEPPVIEEVPVAGHDCVRARGAGEGHEVVVRRVADHPRRRLGIAKNRGNTPHHRGEQHALLLPNSVAEVPAPKAALELAEQSLASNHLDRPRSCRLDKQRRGTLRPANRRR